MPYRGFIGEVDPSEWFTRYGARLEDDRLPKDQAKHRTLAEMIGADGIALFHALYAPSAPASLRDFPAVEVWSTER
jgi:hypothetical protein